MEPTSHSGNVCDVCYFKNEEKDNKDDVEDFEI